MIEQDIESIKMLTSSPVIAAAFREDTESITDFALIPRWLGMTQNTKIPGL